MRAENILTLGERLQKLLEKTEDEAMYIITEAQTKADEMVNSAKEESERRLIKAQYRTGLDEFLKDAEEESTKEAQKIRINYTKMAEKIRAVSKKKIKEAAELVIKEVMSG